MSEYWIVMVDESPAWNPLVGGFVLYPSLESASSAQERLTGKARAESYVGQVTYIDITEAGKEGDDAVPSETEST
jgi:hypothetical protein